MLFHIDAEIILFNENDYVTIDTASCLYFLFDSIMNGCKSNALLKCINLTN